MKNSPCDTCVRPGRMTGNICIYEAECEKYHAWLRNTQEQIYNSFQPKEQIVYIPTHANNDMAHPDAEFGFVTRDVGEKGVFCRYWSRSSLEKLVRCIRNHLPYSAPELRTKANSELTPRKMLERYNVCDRAFVDDAWKKYVEPSEVKIMNADEYQKTQDNLVMIARIISGFDLEGMLTAINKAETLAPIVDPSLYKSASEKMEQMKELVRAALMFQKEVKRQQSARGAESGD